jgi:uncharacterized GH25 family protein
MMRTLGAAVVGLLAAAAAQAHFAYIVPDADGAKAKVVFSDTLEPDTNVKIEKIANTKLTLRDAAGKDSPLAWTPGEGFYAVNVPGSGPRTVFGVTEYGVLAKGDSKPYLLAYYPKAVIGGAAKPVGAKLELAVAGESGKTRFQVLAEGKPVAGAEYSVLVPGAGKKAGKTDPDGFTEVFAANGRYGVYTKQVVAKGGEYNGKRYEEARSYATLVADVPAK